MDNLDLDALALIVRDMIAAAYSEGATDVHNAWVNETNGREPDFGEAASDYAASNDILTAIDLPAIIRKAKAEAYEDAAKVADTISDEWTAEWRKGHKANSHLEGMSDGACDIAAAIRQRAGEVTK